MGERSNGGGERNRGGTTGEREEAGSYKLEEWKRVGGKHSKTQRLPRVQIIIWQSSDTQREKLTSRDDRAG